MPGCTTWFKLTVNNTTGGQSCYEIYPGPAVVRCMVTYFPGMAGPAQAIPVTVNINVPPPDTVSVSPVTSGSVALGTNINIIFAMTSKGLPIAMATGYAQERITNAKNPQGAISMPDLQMRSR
jgi:hypothetical protein